MRHYDNKVHFFLVLKIAFNLRFKLTFYDNSKFVLFFNLSEKRKLDFINFHLVFSISVLLPEFPPLFPGFPPIFPAFPPRFPAFPSHSPHPPHFHPDSQLSHPHSPHCPHSVPRFPIPSFTDSFFLNNLFKLNNPPV